VDQIEPSPLSRLTDLQELDISGCQMSRLYVDFLQNNSLINRLILRGNELDYIPTTALYNLRENLEYLDFSENPVHNLSSHDFHGLYGLKILVFDNMPELEYIGALALHDLHSLEQFECRFNPNLKHIHPLAFRDNLYQDSLPRVENLYLEGNALTSLSAFLVDWNYVRRLTLYENPWNCDCDLAWISDFSGLNSTWLSDVRCYSPEDFAGKLFYDVQDSINCDAESIGIVSIAFTVLVVFLCSAVSIYIVFLVLRFRKKPMPFYIRLADMY